MIKIEKINWKDTIFNSKSSLKIVLVLILFGLVFFSLISGINAKTFDEGTSSIDIQNFINNEQESALIFNAGNYTNLQDLNITRTISISANGQVNIIGSGGTLFNVSANNVVISNLNISGYQTAIISNNSKISIIGNNISTNDVSINCTGSNSLDILLENNQIVSSHSKYGSGAVYIKAPLGSVANIHVKGNNITANGNANSAGMWLDIGGYYYQVGKNENTLIFEDNQISGVGYGLFVLAGNYKNDMIFINNYITSTGDYYANSAVKIELSGGNHTMNFTNNTFIGSELYSSALYIFEDSSTSNNNNIILNDNIFKALSYGYGFYFSDMGSNNNITLNNNDISGSQGSRMGVHLDIAYSNNTITFTNNNIKGIDNADFAVHLYADASNNTIIFSNNNLTGVNSALSLIADFANNDITFTNNNLIGTSNAAMILGVYYYDRMSNNINFIGNNFTGNRYAIDISAFGDVDGLFFVNNTFISNDTGIHVWLFASTIENINFIGNTIVAGKKGFAFEEKSPIRSNIGFTVNYNRIIAPIGLDFSNVNDYNSNFDYNWWGINDFTSKIIGFNINNHYLLNIINLTSLDNVSVGDKVSFSLLVLNTTMTNVGVEKLPYFVINGNFNGVEFNTNRDNSFIQEFTIIREGLELLLAHLDEQEMGFSFESLAYENPDNGTDNDINIQNLDKSEDPDNGNDKGRAAGSQNIETNPEIGNDDFEIVNDDFEKNSDNNLTGYASMKPTGVPIALLLMLAIFTLATFRRKK